MNRLLLYLKNPDYCENQKPANVYIIFLLVVYIVSAILIAPVIFIICKYFHIEHDKIVFGPVETILLGLILAPIYEEILFRALLRFTKRNVILFILTVCALIVYKALDSKIEYLIVLCIMLVSILLILLIASRAIIESYISSKFNYFFYASAISFGLAHASNFSGNIYAILAFAFILGGPQIILGLILGFVRMNYGLIYSIIFHIIVNSSLLFQFL